MDSFTVKGKTYDFYNTTGKVAMSSKNMETNVYSTGGGSYVSQGNTYVNPVSVSSSTTIHDQIFLIDDGGKEHSFQLRDFNVACREGHRLSLNWAVPRGQKTGPYVIVINWTTSKVFFREPAIRGLLTPGYSYVWKITGIGALVGAVLGGSMWFMGIVIASAIILPIAFAARQNAGRKRAKKFMNEMTFKRIAES